MAVFKFNAEITCEGCVNAIKRSLDRSLGDKLLNLESNVPEKSVTLTVDDSVTQQQCLDALQKSGKECSIA
uniref:Uncharacterized protein n=1 Tax=Tetranychus urticae TaxID=32264 RepID=T1KDU9_TETUR